MIKTNKYDDFSVQKTKASVRNPLLYEYCAVFVCSRHFYIHRKAIPSLCTMHSALCTNNSSINQNLKSNKMGQHTKIRFAWCPKNKMKKLPPKWSEGDIFREI